MLHEETVIVRRTVNIYVKNSINNFTVVLLKCI